MRVGLAERRGERVCERRSEPQRQASMASGGGNKFAFLPLSYKSGD